MDYDVAIIGASSSGLYTARELAQAGKRVAVFEQSPVLRPARRTLIVTPHLRQVLDLIPSSIILHRVHSLVLASNRRSLRVDLNDPDLIVERGHLIHWLADEARAAGAAIHLGYRFQRIESDTLWIENSARELLRIRAGAILGADGVFSDVGRASGIGNPPTAPILQAEVELPESWDPAVTQVWFDTEDTRFFYWLIPESRTRAVVGLVGNERTRLRPLLTRFLQRHGLRALAYQGARIALHQPSFRPWGRAGGIPIYLVGDAAGQVKVTTVGGTVSGILGAQAATRSLLRGTAYQVELRALKRELDLHWFMRWILDRLDNDRYEELLRQTGPAVLGLLAKHNRDAMAGVAWRLPLLQPGLIPFVLSIFLGSARPSSHNSTVAQSLPDQEL